MTHDTTKGFSSRHIGLSTKDQVHMLAELGFDSIDELIAKTLPDSIRTNSKLNIGSGITEFTLLKTLKRIASKNKVYRSYIGMGYYGTITPPATPQN